jgi:hypothetical protein
VATVCDESAIGTNPIKKFQITFDPTYNFYTGDAQGGTSSQLDLEGVSSHEFGHVVGGWDIRSQNYHFQSPRDGAVCETPYSTNKHTMCVGWPNGSNHYYRRSLEPHDIHTYVNRYAPGG